MQVPKRKSEEFSKSRAPTDHFLTQAALDKMKNDLTRLEKELPEAKIEVQRTAAMGDLSENAGYQTAKARLRGMNDRIAELKARITQAKVIESTGHGGAIGIGATVTLDVNGNHVTYQLLGSHETNPARGLISYLSPLGAALMGHKVGDSITVPTKDREISYHIIDIT